MFSRLDYGSLALRPAALLALLVGADQILIQPTRTFTSGLPTVWSPAPSPDITTVPTGQFALAGLSPTRTSTSFTALTGPICARALKSRVLLELETRGHQDWPVKSATRTKAGNGILGAVGLRLGSCFRLVPAGYIDPFARVVDYLKEQIERINRSRTAASSR